MLYILWIRRHGAWHYKDWSKFPLDLAKHPATQGKDWKITKGFQGEDYVLSRNVEERRVGDLCQDAEPCVGAEVDG